MEWHLQISRAATAFDREHLAKLTAGRAEAIAEQARDLPPGQAAMLIANAGSTLPAEARSLLTHVQAMRQQQEYQQDAQQKAAIERQIEREFDNLRSSLPFTIEREWRAAIEQRQLRENGEFLERLAARADQLTQQQAAAYGAAYLDDIRVPATVKHDAAAARLTSGMSAVYYDEVRKRVDQRPDAAILRPQVDAIDAGTNAQKIETGIKEDARPDGTGGKATSAEDVKKRLTDSLLQQPGLTEEQRSKAAETVSQAVDRYVEKHNLQGGFPADAAAARRHSEGIRLAVSDAMLEHVDPSLKPEAVLQIAEKMEADLDQIDFSKPGASARVEAVAQAAAGRIRQEGIDPGHNLDPQAVTADIGRQALKDAAAAIKAPQAATALDVAATHAQAHVAASFRTPEPAATAEASPIVAWRGRQQQPDPAPSQPQGISSATERAIKLVSGVYEAEKENAQDRAASWKEKRANTPDSESVVAKVS